MAELTEFVDCTSLNISYDIMGLATVNFVVVRNEEGFPSSDFLNDIEAGGRTFTGYVTSITVNPIQNTDWYESHVTLISLAR